MRTALVLCAALAATGCVSARMSDTQIDHDFRGGRYGQAEERLRRGLADQGEDGKDLLLYLLDLGLTLHTEGKFEESIQAFLRADKLAEIKDYTSIAAETATVLASDNIKDYKGEDFEKVLINTYLAMNYALLGDRENAEVEARRVNHKLQLMVTEGKRKYKQNAFARYLSATLYEADGDYNNAYVDYKMIRDLEPGFPGLGQDLWRMAYVLHDTEALEQLDEDFSLSGKDHEAAKRALPKSGLGEIIVLYENGISPIKYPDNRLNSIPRFYPRHNPVATGRVILNGVDAGQTHLLHNVETTAIENLEEKYGGIVAKKVAGAVVKGAIGYGIARATRSGLLGELVAYALIQADQADCRSWNLLPHDFQVLRIPVGPGTYTVRVDPVGAAPLPEKIVQVGAGKKIYVDFRYIP
ncbi:MAG: COG3014 family protein [Bdellovibrionota bacterium]